MSRPRKPARLWLDEQEYCYYIRDFPNVKESTGFGRADSAKAERELEKYLAQKQAAADPSKQLRKDNPNETRVEAVLALEMERVAALPDIRKRTAGLGVGG